MKRRRPLESTDRSAGWLGSDDGGGDPNADLPRRGGSGRLTATRPPSGGYGTTYKSTTCSYSPSG
ncbi:MAG: hypothetical protein JWR58_4599 [Pseudonocardia sp.]|jgi:hypothetical protein|nr:hypothetical protein [Pseudonocardia sp.]